MPETWIVTRESGQGTQTWAGFRLGRNDHGLWLYAPEGTAVRAGDGRQLGALPKQVVLVPDGEPWVATWTQTRCLVAVTTAAEVGPLTINYRDLGVRCWIDDGDGVAHDGTAERSAAVDTATRSILADLERRLVERIEPFGEIGRRWFSGITRNQLRFVDYDPGWPARFTSARAVILPVLPAGSRVEHFGSTAVPGLAAKDCIDIAAVVPRADQVADAIVGLEAIGYEARPHAFDDPGHIFLRLLEDGHRSHHLHLYHEGHPNLVDVLAFRDLLRSDPAARQRYQEVKRSLAETNPYDRSGYLDGKSAVVQELLQRARARIRKQ